jgi:ABC-type anion transport system duplicated permease subunit
MGLTTFQIISIIISALLLLSSIVGVYIKLKVDITKIEVKVAEIEKDVNFKATTIKKDLEDRAKELASDIVQRDVQVLLNEKNNREDHKEILVKIDKIIEKINK